MTDTSDPDVMNLADALSVTWRPGEPRRLTYVEREGGEDAVYDYRFDIDASERVVAFDERISGRWGQVDWNHDGTKLLYTRDGDVRVYDTQTGEESTPAPSIPVDSSPRWSSVDDRIAFISDKGDAGNDICVVDVDG